MGSAVGDGVKPQNDPELNAISIPVARVQVAPVAAAPTRTEILEQLDRILKSPAFSKSQRYSAFLQYCVETALGGHSEFLKERTIGIEVFERKTNYEPGIDHVVRSAASEVRRRLAQYYQGGVFAGAPPRAAPTPPDPRSFNAWTCADVICLTRYLSTKPAMPFS
jgi:hypothetical protein